MSLRGYDYPDLTFTEETVILPPLSLDNNGNLAPDPKCNVVLLATESTINRIDSNAWPREQGRLSLLFQTKGHLGNKAGNSGSFFAIDLGNAGGLSVGEAAQLDLGANATVNLLLYQNTWILDLAGTT